MVTFLMLAVNCWIIEQWRWWLWEDYGTKYCHEKEGKVMLVRMPITNPWISHSPLAPCLDCASASAGSGVAHSSSPHPGVPDNRAPASGVSLVTGPRGNPERYPDPSAQRSRPLAARCPLHWGSGRNLAQPASVAETIQGTVPADSAGRRMATNADGWDGAGWDGGSSGL